MIDLIELWVDTHPFFSCLCIGGLIGLMSGIDDLSRTNTK
ncbi:hypothetical protein FRUB_04272 [Fimbriiglobus ruber]|uniref:Uncharacterized protein n=1 Tax=Fimbriiglobus ruber TaxID=1908690 RepID=A0A225DRD1_9BACT|nr:hypothetical protein FRUB_04272 [Fimbriiglobus ruber]